MTPGARIAAAIDVVDRIAAGTAPEQALTGWARGARFAGSKDRAAVRDHVFDVLRRWRSTAHDGGAGTGRGRLIGLLRQQGTDPEALFTGAGYAPAPLGEDERAAVAPACAAVQADLPDWLWPLWQARFGAQAQASADLLRHRAPVFVRVNTRKGDLAAAQAALAADGIDSRPVERAATALELTARPRALAGSAAFAAGLVEPQDASSQAVIAALPLAAGARVLDYCAGGGGKALAIAARTGAGVDVHDAAPRRMRDVPARAARAGVHLTVQSAPRGPYDLVLCDVPCSGSGAWRRAPQGKWLLTAEGLADLQRRQTAILHAAAALVRPGGILAYVTCSVLAEENDAPPAAFLADTTGWRLADAAEFAVGPMGDGMALRVLENR